MTLSLMELLGGIATGIGCGWVLLQLAFRQFEKRLDEKFDSQSEKIAAQSSKIAILEQISNEVKRLELESMRVESRGNITFATKEELLRSVEKMEKQIERVFSVAERIEQKLDSKVDRDELRKGL